MAMPSSPSSFALQRVLAPDRQLEQNDLDGFELNYPLSWSIVTGYLGSIMGIVFLCSMVVMCSILRTILKKPSSNQWQPQQRRGPADTSKNLLQSFNIYLLFIILPDSLLNGIASVGLLWEATHEGKYTPGLCIARNSASCLHYYINLYLNAVVGREVYILINNSHQRRRTLPPSLRKVACQVISLYGIMGILVTWMMIQVPWSPSNVADLTYCYQEVGSPEIDGKPGPVFNESTGTIVGMFIVGPPLIYVLWVGYDVYRRNLLPSRGRTRALAIYFFRIVVVFLLFYIPNLTIIFIYNLIPYKQVTLRFWLLTAFTAMIPVQCLVTLRVALEKSDIQESFLSLTDFFSMTPSGNFTGRTSSCMSDEAQVGSSVPRAGSAWDSEDAYAPNATITSAAEIGMAASKHDNGELGRPPPEETESHEKDETPALDNGNDETEAIHTV